MPTLSTSFGIARFCGGIIDLVATRAADHFNEFITHSHRRCRAALARPARSQDRQASVAENRRCLRMAAEIRASAPLFKKITVKLENGKEVILNAPENSADNKYIQSMTFTGTDYSKNWLSYPELMKGATINFKMGNQPNMKRGIDDKDFPYSFTNELKK